MGMYSARVFLGEHRIRHFFQTTGVLRVATVEFLFRFSTSDLHILGVYHDDMVADIN